jgi:hypothetical protein
MNYNSMSDFELLHYLDIYSEDPVIRRLVDFLSNTRGGLITDLEAAGMDPHTWMFETEWQHMYPGDYIQQLRRDVEEAESNLRWLQDDHQELEDKYNELKTRSIMDFVEEVNKERVRASLTASEARKETEKVREENAKLREQIDMWGKMNRVS